MKNVIDFQARVNERRPDLAYEIHEREIDARIARSRAAVLSSLDELDGVSDPSAHPAATEPWPENVIAFRPRAAVPNLDSSDPDDPIARASAFCRREIQEAAKDPETRRLLEDAGWRA